MPTLTEYDDKPDTRSSSGDHDNLSVDSDQRQAEINSLNSSFYRNEDTGADLNQSESRVDDSVPKTKADNTEQNQLASMYNPEKDKPSKSGGFFKRNKKKLIGGGAVTGGIAGIIASFMLLLPLKVQHMVNNLQQNFFASSEQATEDATNKLLRTYIVKKVMPGMIEGRCTSTLVNRNCAAGISDAKTPIGALFNTWRDVKFEQKLADRGIVVERRGQGGTNNFRLVTPSSIKTGGSDLGNFDPDRTDLMDSKLAQAMNRGEVRREVRKSFENETLGKRIFYHYKVGKFMERKYGVTRCLVACDTRDNIRNKVDDKKLAWKKYFVDRVIVPRSALYGAAIICALDGGSCGEAPDQADENGERRTPIEETARSSTAERNSRNRNLDDPELQRLTEDFRNKGFTNHFIEKALGEVIAKKSITVIPWVGQVIAIAQFWDILRSTGPAMKNINYAINAQTMVTTYMMYRTHADEIKTGKLDAVLVGSVAESLGSNAGTDQNGGAAESSPYYSEFMNGDIKKGGYASVLNPFGAKAFAAEGYKCNEEDSYITSGVCPELDLSESSGYTAAAEDLSKVLNSPAFAPLNITVDFLNFMVGLLKPLLDLLGEAFMFLFNLLPDSVKEAGSKMIAAFAEWFVTLFINNALGDSPSGGRMFDLMAGGADVSGNTYAHYGLGAQVINNEQAASIRLARNAEAREDFEGKSYFAKIFDTSSKYSFASQIAVAMPSTGNGLSQSLLGSFLNPFSALSGVPIGVSNDIVSAQNNSSRDLFGVTQYGYLANDPVFSADPEKYWEDNKCSDPETVKSWGEGRKDTPFAGTSVINPDTGIPENSKANGCMLLEASVAMAGGIFNDSLIGEDTGTSSIGSPDEDASEFVAATYNVQNKRFTGETYEARTKKQAAIITGQTNESNNPVFDIVGTQEISDLQFLELRNLLPNYGSWPANGDRLDAGQDGAVAIFWNKSKFTKFTDGKTPGISNDSRDITVPWVGLKTSTGQNVYVISVHYATAKNGGSPERLRASAQKTLDWVREKKKDGIVIVLGDFNDNLNEKITYCEYVRDGLMQHAADMAAGADPNAGCNSDRYGDVAQKIDHVYATPKDGLLASKWVKMKQDGIINEASDHSPAYAVYRLPSTGDGEVVSANGLTFPLKTTQDVLKKGAEGALWCYNNPANCHHDYNAADIHAPTGTIVVAAKGGKVVSAKDNDDSAVGSRVTIMGNDNRLYYYAHMGNGTIKVRNNQTITAGTEIGKVGTSSDAVETAPHLHIDVLPGSTYKSRPSCSGASCTSYPFVNIQPALFELFKVLP